MATPAAPVSVLPRYIAIKGDNGFYLNLKSDGLLTFDAPQITRLSTHEVLYNVDDPNATFIIRSQNNRFWRRDATAWIRADRDAGSPPSANDTAARFKVANLASGKLAFQSAADDLYLNRLSRQLIGYNALERVPNQSSEVEVSDAREHAVFLPQYISIMGDNGKYLHTHLQRNIRWLKFHGNDPSNLYGTTEVIHLLNGAIVFYSPQTLRCWENTGGWVWTDATRSNALTNTACHFEAIKLSSRMIAVRSLHNDRRLCSRHTDYWESSLHATSGITTATVLSHLTIKEAVNGRNVFDIKYLLNLASTSDQMPLTVAFGSAVNDSSHVIDMAVSVSIQQNVSTSYTFSNSFTFSQTVETSFSAGIPFLADGEINLQIGFEQSFSNQWDETTSRGIEFSTVYTVKDVQPGARATVSIVCSSAKIRIPFTYKMRETALDGTYRPVQEFVDGIFEGVDAYKIEAVISNGDTSSVEPVQSIRLIPL